MSFPTPSRELSLRDSPAKRREVNFEPATTSRLRLGQVMDKCKSLQKDVGVSLKGMTDRVTMNLTNLRKELDSPVKNRWKSSSQYIEVKERIQRRELEAKEHHVQSQISAFQSQIASEPSQRDLRLTVRKTLIYRGKKAKEVEEPVHISAQMLGTYLMAQKLVKNPRGFAERREGSRRNSSCEDVNQYLAVEGGKQENMRWGSFGREIEQRTTEQSETTLGLDPAKPKLVSGLSPLQLFVLTYNSRKLAMDNEHIPTLHRRAEARMLSIQPSRDVIALSKKYLPKRVQFRKNTANFSKALPKPFQSPQKEPTLSQERDLDTAQEDEFLKEEIQREMRDTGKLLNMESILSSAKKRGNHSVKRKLALF